MKGQHKSRYAVRLADQPVHNQHSAGDADWIRAGGDPRDSGRYVEVISRALTGARTLLFGLAWLDPGEIHLLHHHPFAEEFCFVLEGSALVTVGDETVRAEPGMGIFLPAGVAHRIENDSSEVFKIAYGYDRSDLNDVGMVWDE